MCKKKGLIIAIFFLYSVSGLFSALAQADVIQDQSNIFMTIDYFEPLGQTFTADRDYLSPVLSLYFYDANPGEALDSLTMYLYEGDGFGGTQLASQTFDLSSGFIGYYDLTFSEINLSTGSVYTLGIESSTKRWAVAVNQLELFPGFPIPGTTDYTGGHAIISNNPMNGYDLRFKVTGGVPPVVPEPISAVLFTTGGSVLIISRYLRKRRKHRL